MDMDSTLINEEGIDLLAHYAGIGEEVTAMTSAAMAGERDFYSALTDRVSLFDGMPEDLLNRVRSSLSLTPGALQLIEKLREENWLIGVVSGGFHEIIDEFLEPLSLDFIKANRFEIANGKFTGKVIPPMIGPNEKVATLIDYASRFSIPLNRCVAIGDGANDRQMVQEAGIGIAFCAKPALREVAKHVIDHRDLSLVLEIIGLS